MRQPLEIFFSPSHSLHAPTATIARGGEIQPIEIPARAEALASMLSAAGYELRGPRDFGIEPIAKMHTEDYLRFLATAHGRWQQLRASTRKDMAPVVQAQAFALGHVHRPPRSFLAEVDHYLGGGYAPIVAGTYEAAIASAHVALEGAHALLAGQPLAYALCRPPGHHAYADIAGGYCYLNNVAIAAQRLGEQFGRVSILDIDVHHGNGTQALFYRRDDVFTVSVHADPTHVYPFCCGFADERGTGAGCGWNLNLPLPAGSGDTAYLEAIRHGVANVQASGAAALLVALGFDAYAGDPTNSMSVTTAGFRAAGRIIGSLRIPTLLVQEGGYAVDALAANLQAFLDGLLHPSTDGILPRPK